MSKSGRHSSRILAIAHGFVISSIAPLALYLAYWARLYENPVYLFAAIGIAWVISVVLALRTILEWERGAHIIQRSEEGGLLDLFQYVHNDLGAFHEYMERFMQKNYGKGATQALYLVNYVNDSSVGLAKVAYNREISGQSTYHVPPYNDLVLPRNESTAILFSDERHVLNRQYIAEINHYANTPLPGNWVYPLIHDARGLMGVWCITLPEGHGETEPPDLVLSMGRFVLENLVTIHALRSEKQQDSRNSNNTVISYQQIVNLVNIVLHEVATPISVIRATVTLLQRNARLSPEQIKNLDDMVVRLQRRMSKMALYANTIGGSELQTAEKPVEEILNGLREGVRKNLARSAQEKGKRIRLEVIPDDLRKRSVLCNDIVVKALWELLENAIVYSPPESVIYLRVSLAPRPGQPSAVSFHFLNKGRIPEDVLRTYRYVGAAQNVMSHSSDNRGIGIGLAMAFVAITRAGGSMSVSNQKEYAAVEVYLPEARP